MSSESSNAVPAIRHGYAQVGDVRLHYAECGEGDRLVVLLHGFPECWYSWRHQLQALGARYRVVAPDMRGYNLSDKPDARRRLPRQQAGGRRDRANTPLRRERGGGRRPRLGRGRRVGRRAALS